MTTALAAVALLGALAVYPAAASAAPSAGSLDVQPFPGTPDASPSSQIEFPTLAPAQLRSIAVTGSRSGHHPGMLRPMPGGQGTAFVASQPFADGEHVSVRARLSSPAAGSATGARGATTVRFSFGVAAPLPVPGPPSTMTRHDILDSDGFTHSFHSDPYIHPPLVYMAGSDPDGTSSGDIFADAENSIQAGPLILNPDGQLIYFQSFYHSAAFDVAVQNYQGQSVLTYWQGYVEHSVGIGTDMIVDHNYQTVARVNAGNGYHADLHEFQILPNGDALITAYAEVTADLRGIHGPKNGTLLDSIIQEVNIATGQVVWEWHAYGHIHLSESYLGKPGKLPYDFFHINSIQLLPNGNLLVSARSTWTVYEIDMQTGKIPYNFGGRNSSFKFGPGASFQWQHDATMQPDGTMTVFDDGDGAYKSASESRALRLRINYQKHRVTLVHAYTSKYPLLSQSQGSVQVLPDGNTFVGWGSQPWFTEYGKNGGKQLFSLHFGKPLQTYRAYRFQWWGQPTGYAPAVAASLTKSGATVYASWDGATDVSSWEVLAGSSATALTPVAQFSQNDFETTMPVANPGPFFAVQAIGSAGQVLAESQPVQAH